MGWTTASKHTVLSRRIPTWLGAAYPLAHLLPKLREHRRPPCGGAAKTTDSTVILYVEVLVLSALCYHSSLKRQCPCRTNRFRAPTTKRKPTKFGRNIRF